MQLLRQPHVRARISIENLSQELKKWLSAKGLVSVDFQEATDLAYDPQDDYRVVYQAEFLPEAPRQARLEIHLTDDGYVGIGFETRQRIAIRLGVRNRRDGFAGGFEPSLSQIDQLMFILDCVATGDVLIQARTILLCGLGHTRAFLRRRHDGARAELRRPMNFLFSTAPSYGVLMKTLTFDAWN